MKRILGLSLCIASLALALLPSLAESAQGQQTGGVFVGRGRISRKNLPRDRAPSTRPYENERADTKEEDDLKPMIAGRRLRDIEDLEQQCLDQVNRVREAHRLVPLEFSEGLLAVAREYSRRMAEENFFSHTDPEGNSVRQRVERASIKWRMIGENLAYSNGYTNPVAASMRGWMDSPGHRKNILDPAFRQTAVGAWISANGTVYFTEIFLK